MVLHLKRFLELFNVKNEKYPLILLLTINQGKDTGNIWILEKYWKYWKYLN